MENNCNNKALCLAPWTHAFVSLTGQRKLCSESSEEGISAQTLDAYWNSEKVREVRRQMLRGETPSSCLGCKDMKNSYQEHFTRRLFPEVLKEVHLSTSKDGSTTLKPRSFDYRISHECNFKCRTCSETFSSSWELENKLHKKQSSYKIDGQVHTFNKKVLKDEFIQAIKSGVIEEINWIGGEPLKWDLHWQVMQFLVDSELSKNIFVRYTTNLSNLNWKGRNLFDEYLIFFKGFQIKASLLSTGKTGEYLRTGMNWAQWIFNLDYAVANTKKEKNQEIILETLITLPTLLELPELVKFINQRDLELELKIYENLEISPLMSPLCIPKVILHSLIDEYAKLIFSQATINNLKILKALIALKKKKTLMEQFPNEWRQILHKNKEELLNLEARRQDKFTMTQILKKNDIVSAWWKEI